MGFGRKLASQSPTYNLLFLLLASTAALHGEIDWKKVDAETFEHFTKLIRIDTSNPPGNESKAAKYLQGILEKEEEKLLLSIVDFGDTRVREVMTPRTDIVWIDVASSQQVLADLFVKSKYSRIPVVRGAIDTVVGTAHVKDVFEAIHAGTARPITELAREAYFVPESKKVSELLREFQRRHLWMAIVVDEYGGVSGLVTVEDLLEEIVGEISDEHEDEREAVTKASENAYSISGRENIATVRELFGRGPEEEEFTSIGGFLAARLGHIPRPGETHHESDLLFTVEEADRRRVHRVRIEAIADSDATAVEARAQGPKSHVRETGI